MSSLCMSPALLGVRMHVLFLHSTAACVNHLWTRKQVSTLPNSLAGPLPTIRWREQHCLWLYQTELNPSISPI